VPFARPLMFFIIFGARLPQFATAIWTASLQSRTLRDRSETALQCGKVKRSPIPIEQPPSDTNVAPRVRSAPPLYSCEAPHGSKGPGPPGRATARNVLRPTLSF
jgi:hypothetical protein